MPNLKTYIEEAISSGRRRVNRPALIDSLEFNMPIQEFWEAIVGIGIPESNENAASIDVRSQLLRNGSVLARKYPETIFLFVGGREYYYVICSMNHKNIDLMTKNRHLDRHHSLPIEQDRKAMDSLKNDLTELVRSGSITESVSSGRHAGLSSVISLYDFHKKLMDLLPLVYEFPEFPGDKPKSIYTKNPGVFFRYLYNTMGDIESYSKREYPDGRTRYYVNVPRYGKDGSLIWHLEFQDSTLISAELYSYYKGNVNKETDDMDAAEDLVDYLNCRTFEEKKKWLLANA